MNGRKTLRYVESQAVKSVYKRGGHEVVRAKPGMFVLIERDESAAEWRTATKGGGRYREAGLHAAARAEVIRYAVQFGVVYRRQVDAVQAVDAAADVEELMP